MRLHSHLAIVLFALAPGCATAQAPTARMEASAAAIRAAEEVGAPRVPRAALHLQLAREESQSARRLIGGGQPELAESQLLCSEAVANPALAPSREEGTRLAPHHRAP